MITKIIPALAIIIAIQGSAQADTVTDFNSLIGGVCRDTWTNLAKKAGWDLAKMNVSKDSLFTYETTPMNNFITCNAIYLNESSADNGAWNLRFGSANPGESLVIRKLNNSTGKWDIVK